MTARKAPRSRPAEKRTSKAARPADAKEGATAVDAWMRDLKPAHRPVVEAVRRAILEAHRDVREGIKWNAPSFRTKEDFATVGPRKKDETLLILHCGAKVRDDSTSGLKIDDPLGMLRWLAKERALVSFRDVDDVQARRSALQAIVRQWIARL